MGDMGGQMSERVRELVDNLDECRHLDELAESIIREMRPFGVERIIGGIHHCAGNDLSPLHNAVLFNTYPKEWIDHYSGGGYASIDPVVRRAHRGTGLQGWTWDEAGLYLPDERDASRVMNEAREFKLVGGISVSTVLPGGDGVVLSLVGSHKLEMSPEDRNALIQVSAHTLHRGYILARQREQIGLTARQIEYLQLASHGLSDEEIAAEMSITAEGARKNLKLSLRKLSANSKPNAVMIALRLGLIN